MALPEVFSIVFLLLQGCFGVFSYVNLWTDEGLRTEDVIHCTDC